MSSKDYMKIKKFSIAISFIASIAFFVKFFTSKNIFYLILGFSWLGITIEEIVRYKNDVM